MERKRKNPVEERNEDRRGDIPVSDCRKRGEERVVQDVGDGTTQFVPVCSTKSPKFFYLNQTRQGFKDSTICEAHGTTRWETNINHTRGKDSPGRKTDQIEFDSQITSRQHSKHRFFISDGIPGDGRCMFRSVVHGACLREGRPVPRENVTEELADDLRTKVVNELIKRRAETEWFLEGDFETYVSHMQRSHVWGGEPELLMSSHVLKVPITVYMRDKKSKSIKVVAEYGHEYGKQNPVSVLYHDYGHYDLLKTETYN